MTSDMVWKGITFATSIILVPLFIWIWNTNTKIETLKNDYKHTVEDLVEAKKEVVKLKEQQTSMDTEIRLIQQKLDIVADNTEEIVKMMKAKDGN